MAIFLFANGAQAADSDLNITCVKKRFEAQPGGAGQIRSEGSAKSEQWGYSVTIENQGFKPLANLEVKYIIYYKHEQLGIKGPPKKETKTGTYTLAALNSLGKTSFDTHSVKLTKASLVGSFGGYTYFANGAKPTATDSLTGLWVRVYKDGNVFAEYAYPAGLTSSEQWQE